MTSKPPTSQELDIAAEARAILAEHGPLSFRPLYPDAQERAELLVQLKPEDRRAAAKRLRIIDHALERGTVNAIKGNHTSLSPYCPEWEADAATIATLQRVQAEAEGAPAERASVILYMTAASLAFAREACGMGRLYCIGKILLGALRRGDELANILTAPISSLRLSGDGAKALAFTVSEVEEVAARVADTPARKRRAEMLIDVIANGDTDTHDEIAARHGATRSNLGAIIYAARHAGLEVAIRNGVSRSYKKRKQGRMAGARESLAVVYEAERDRLGRPPTISELQVACVEAGREPVHICTVRKFKLPLTQVAQLTNND